MQQILEFAGNHPMLIGAAVVLGALLVATELKQRLRGFAEITPAEAVQLVNRDGVVVDVREPGRFAAGHIVGARNVPLDVLAGEADKKLGKYRNKPVVICCESGVSSSRAGNQLRRLGFEQIFNLRGGLDAWRRENYPLERGGK